MPARPDRLLTNRDLQARLRLSRTSIHFMVKRGEFPAPVQIGRARRWRESDVNAWIAAQTAAGADGDSRPPA